MVIVTITQPTNQLVSLVVLSDVEVLYRNLHSTFKVAEEELTKDDPPQVLISFVADVSDLEIIQSK